MKKTISIILVSVLIFTLFAGCGKDGGVSTDGSTSMSKVIETLAEVYENENGINVTYNPTGSGSGIQAVSEGRCDIGLSSRNLNDSEKAKGLCETALAYDGIAVIVNGDNPISDLSVEMLCKIFTGEIANWKDVGGTDGEIVVVGREAGSGTRDGFEEATQTKDECKYRQEQTSTGDVITTVAGNPLAVGYASLASVKSTVKAISVDGVTVSAETVKSGEYAVRRPFVLVTREGEELSVDAKGFFEYITSEAAREYIESCGVVPAN